MGLLSEASKRLLRRPSVPALKRSCNRDCSSSEPHAAVDTRPGNFHTCDIHFAISALSSPKEKALERGRN
jgi:hypothetical protein